MTDHELDTKIRQILANVKEWDRPRKLVNLCRRYATHQRQQAVAEFAREVLELVSLVDDRDDIRTLLEKHNIQL